jgi:hypothetical protein
MQRRDLVAVSERERRAVDVDKPALERIRLDVERIRLDVERIRLDAALVPQTLVRLKCQQHYYKNPR